MNAFMNAETKEVISKLYKILRDKGLSEDLMELVIWQELQKLKKVTLLFRDTSPATEFLKYYFDDQLGHPLEQALAKPRARLSKRKNYLETQPEKNPRLTPSDIQENRKNLEQHAREYLEATLGVLRQHPNSGVHRVLRFCVKSLQLRSSRRSIKDSDIDEDETSCDNNSDSSDDGQGSNEGNHDRNLWVPLTALLFLRCICPRIVDLPSHNHKSRKTSSSSVVGRNGVQVAKIVQSAANAVASGYSGADSGLTVFVEECRPSITETFRQLLTGSLSSSKSPPSCRSPMSPRFKKALPPTHSSSPSSSTSSSTTSSPTVTPSPSPPSTDNKIRSTLTNLINTPTIITASATSTTTTTTTTTSTKPTATSPPLRASGSGIHVPRLKPLPALPRLQLPTTAPSVAVAVSPTSIPGLTLHPLLSTQSPSFLPGEKEDKKPAPVSSPRKTLAEPEKMEPMCLTPRTKLKFLSLSHSTGRSEWKELETELLNILCNENSQSPLAQLIRQLLTIEEGSNTYCGVSIESLCNVPSPREKKKMRSSLIRSSSEVARGNNRRKKMDKWLADWQKWTSSGGGGKVTTL
eukprot:TRINITY_DN2929_c0_g1_i1.p1 TRINITY_DN2929_c0_g1~~TRINITY_DN2929_c0_g1_i1.p1  ORF type:complete len:602 (-),score=110.95 TRINITY_DN2929_c0_g1_i1:165-1898(-)